MDGVDFRLTEVDPRRVGYKALAVNLSDLAAMAAKPRAALVGLVLLGLVELGVGELLRMRVREEKLTWVAEQFAMQKAS